MEWVGFFGRSSVRAVGHHFPYHALVENRHYLNWVGFRFDASVGKCRLKLGLVREGRMKIGLFRFNELEFLHV